MISRAEIRNGGATRVLLAALACGFAACETKEPAAVEVVDLAGLKARIAQHAGRPLLLNFWAMW